MCDGYYLRLIAAGAVEASLSSFIFYLSSLTPFAVRNPRGATCSCTTRDLLLQRLSKLPAFIFALCSLLFALCSFIFHLSSFIFALCSLLFVLYNKKWGIKPHFLLLQLPLLLNEFLLAVNDIDARLCYLLKLAACKVVDALKNRLCSLGFYLDYACKSAFFCTDKLKLPVCCSW